MSTVEGRSGETGGTASSGPVDLKLEVVVVPVADADRSKAFYAALGWKLDADLSFDYGFRVVQFTPPGSLCSVQSGTEVTGPPPGSAHGPYLVVPDVEAGRHELTGPGAKVSEVSHPGAPGARSWSESWSAASAPTGRASPPSRYCERVRPSRASAPVPR